MAITDFPSKWLRGGGAGASIARLSLRSLFLSIGFLFLVFGGNSANALDYKLDYGVDAGSASDEGVVACSTGPQECVAEIKSLGVKLYVRVSAKGGSIRAYDAGMRDCCFFEDETRFASVDVDGTITKLPFFSYVGGTGQVKKLGVLYVRILTSEPWPNAGDRRRPVKRGPVKREPFWSDERSSGL